MNNMDTTVIMETTHPMVKYLTKVLADTYVLAVKTHGAHWNVTGADFFRLHAVFDEQYQALLLAADELAERIRALDAPAPGSMGQLLRSSSIADAPGGNQHPLVRALRDDHRHIATVCRDAIVIAEQAHDPVSADLLTSRAQAHDKIAWMLTASLGD